MRRRLAVVIFVSGMLATTAWSQTLPLPPNLISANSAAGESFFFESEAREAYFPLANHFVTQKHQSYCGVASIVMVLNALQITAPAVPEFDPFRTFTQDNVLDARTDAVLPRDVLLKKGMTLDQLGGLLALHPLKVEVRHAGDTTLEEFRAPLLVARDVAICRCAKDLSRSDIEPCTMPRASHLVALDVSLRQWPFLMSAGIVQGKERALDVK